MFEQMVRIVTTVLLSVNMKFDVEMMDVLHLRR
jgi:hypothetical protein